MDNNEIIKQAEVTPQERAALLNSRINANTQLAAESLVAVGRDLKAMRDEKLYTEFGCETFEEYCEAKTQIKQRQAYNFIKCYEKYGERLGELSHIGITKLALMAALDDEDREQLIESGEAENLSTREMEKRIKELQSKCEQLTLELSEKSKDENIAALLKQQIEQLNTELEAAQTVQKQQKESLESEKKALEERVILLEQQNKELTNRPVDVAVQQPSKEDIAKIEKAAAEKAEKAAQKKHDAEVKKLREEYQKIIQSERITATNAAKKESSVEIEKLKSENASLQALAKKAPPIDSKKERLKFYLEECQRNFNAAFEATNLFEGEEQTKYRAALKTIINKMAGFLDEQ